MANTGYKAWYTLEQYNTVTGAATGTTKANTSGDPDYVAPVYDVSSCPLPPVDNTAPTLNTSLTTGRTTQTSVDLFWSFSDDTGVTSQQVYHRQTAGGLWALTNISAGATTHTVTQLTEGNEYEFYVRACDAENNCTNSNTVIKTVTVPVTTYAHQLGYGNDINSACNDANSPFTITYYTNNSNFSGSTKIWSNSAGTTLAPSGYYSDGTVYLSWTAAGSGSVFGSGFCGGFQ